MSKQRGFTLIEMALVIVIMGLIVGGGVVAVGPIVETSRLNQTNTALDQIESALVLFAIRNNRLPCPADGSLANTNSQYGLEAVQDAGNNGSAADFTDNNCPVSAANSVIPWRTLGLDETYSLDGWQSRISYFPAVPNLGGAGTGWDTLVDLPASGVPVNCLSHVGTTSAPPQGYRSSAACDPPSPTNSVTPTPTPATSNNTFGSYDLPTYPFGSYIPVTAIDTATLGLGNELTQANPVGTITDLTVHLYGLRAAYVLISHGKTGWYGWTRGGTQRTPPGSTTYTFKKYNSGALADRANLGFVQSTPISAGSTSSATYFDDIVRWRSPAFIIQQCGGAACGNP